MPQIVVDDHRVALWGAAFANLQALDRKIGEMQTQRQHLSLALQAEVRKAGLEQGYELPDQAQAEIKDDRVLITWKESPPPPGPQITHVVGEGDEDA